LKSLSVVKVKAYVDALTIYSTEHRQIGEIKSSPGFLITRNQGIPSSKFSFRGEFNAFEGVISNRNIVETYVHVGGFKTTTGKSSRLILEIYTDVTPLVAEIEQSKANLIAGLIFLFAALYGVLVLIARRADLVIDRQYEDLNREITNRKRVEKTQERLTQAVENVPVVIALFDGDDRLVFCNDRYAEKMEVLADILKPGLTFEELIRTIVDRQPVKDAQGREEEFIRERVERHRNPTGPVDICRAVRIRG